MAAKSRKHKAWGIHSGQIVAGRNFLTTGKPKHVIIRSRDVTQSVEIAVTRSEIPSLIMALLEVGGLD